ncbi:DNA polymerase III subunit delta' [Geomicrobium sediminis]|uniref:DNA polymerase-3 subunit delta n=1 Tax=Geomicrobium sediminis TaxID=1347788 RepID=A0ABS2PI74_9BACL|nr:DNA polymerase III subunit delta' [Geomicrobium sediminis]MBM7635130.1 DNA polymerase-3 subunit delta' [Geomicrobium sediminis]
MKWEQLQTRQPVVAKLLRHAVVRERLPHAYIFEGEDRSEQVSAASLLCRAFLCQKDAIDKPCGECSDCRRVESGNHPDVTSIKPDGQSIKKHQVERLQKEFTYKGMESVRKVYIIEEADLMTASAANSLLTFLEEPEGETLAILITSNLHFLLPTIVSRSQVLTFAPLSEVERQKVFQNEGETEVLAAIKARIREIPADIPEEERLTWIVHGRQVVIQLAEEVLLRPRQARLFLQEKWHVHFKDRNHIETGLDLILFWYRDVLYTKWNREDLAYPDQLERLRTEGLHRSELMLAANMKAVIEAKRYLSANVNPQLIMERLLFRIQEGS